MPKQNILQSDYTQFPVYYQIKLPFELEKTIEADDPVRLLSAFVEGMDLSNLYATYGKIRKNQASPRQLLKIVIYAAMNGIRSSRGIERACKRDINFMYLLEGMPVPDNTTIARFFSIHLSSCSKNIFAEAVCQLKDIGEISGKTVFIDGTKIEACANKYTFVWKRAVTKNQEKLFDKISLFVAECENLYGIKTVYNGKISARTLKRLRKQLMKIKKEESITFVHGKGKRKTPLQRSVEALDEYIDKIREYNYKLHTCGDRNSYSKTDHDATFMRLKEDAMQNGQLKPAYNVQHAADAQYVTWVNVSQRPTDTLTLIPLLQDMEVHLPFKYREILADSGYESEESYVFIESNRQEAYIKPANFEISKSRTYKADISRRENMDYDTESDTYTCKEGRKLTAVKESHKKTASGYQRTVTIYECEDCTDCPCKSKCIKGNNCHTPLDERKKKLSVSRVYEEKRRECLEGITTERGTLLRMNRSIQAEGSFAFIKEDMGFRQYLYRGKENVLTESIVAAFAYDILKLHFKIQKNKTGIHLTELNQTA